MSLGGEMGDDRSPRLTCRLMRGQEECTEIEADEGSRDAILADLVVVPVQMCCRSVRRENLLGTRVGCAQLHGPHEVGHTERVSKGQRDEVGKAKGRIEDRVTT